MRPTDTLSADHRIIEQVLDCLECLARAARVDGSIDSERSGVALKFLSEFADRLHHGKEERLLFPALHARGISENVGPIPVMLNEHDLGRSELARMRVALEQSDAPGFAASALDYVELLRDHIAKEDGVLFPMGEEQLTDEDRRDLLAAFERADREFVGPISREALVKSADELASSLGVPFGTNRPQTPRTHSCGLGYGD